MLPKKKSFHRQSGTNISYQNTQFAKLLQSPVYSSQANSQSQQFAFAPIGISPYGQKSNKNSKFKSNRLSIPYNNSDQIFKNARQQNDKISLIDKRNTFVRQESKQNIPGNCQMSKIENSKIKSKFRVFTQPEPEKEDLLNCISPLTIQNSKVNKEASFKKFIQNRCKTPIILQNRPESHKNSYTNIKKSRFQFFDDLFKKKLPKEQPRSVYEEESRTKFYCCNNDGKQAKYRVVSQEQFCQELLFCSKCTIALVQQGFILQQIKSTNGINKQKLIFQKTQVQKCLQEIEIIKKKQMNKLNKYYQKLLQVVENQKQQSYLNLEQYFDQIKKSYQENLHKINQNIEKSQSQSQKLESQILCFKNQKQKYYPNVIYPSRSVQEFSDFFHNFFSPNINLETKNKEAISNQDFKNYSSQALRFSFQKMEPRLSSQHSLQIESNIKLSSPQVLKADDELEYSNSQLFPNNESAFRDLFPQAVDSLKFKNNVSSPTFKNL